MGRVGCGRQASLVGARAVSEPSALVAIAGHQLEVEFIAAPADPALPETIVLLHEALGSVSHWRDFPQRLAERCQANVLVYSRLGHGNSEGPPHPRTRPYFERQSLVVLPALLQHFAIARPVLFGHSEGAGIALLYAAMQPDRVLALVLESPILQLEPIAAAGMQQAEAAWRDTDFRERLARYHRDPDAVFAAWLTVRNSGGLLQTPLEQHLPPVTCPLLMIQGERDEYGTPRQAEILRPLAPHMEWMQLPEAGHTPHRERPEAVLERVAAFLAPFAREADSYLTRE
jgi:pimeloyl-ACP methyl ester carboxylesterase